MVVGPTRDSIQRNVLYELCSLLGFPIPTPKTTQVNMFNRIIYLVGANDERAQRRIQGSTIAIAYVDELTLIPQGFFKMLLSRLSVKGAKLFGTTNPDSPFHWLKIDMLDNPEIDIARWKFTLDDNPSLDSQYIDSIKKEYQGLWYKRYINGDWVLAEGTVYEFFNEDEHVIDFPSRPAQYYIVGVDYGTTNPTVFTLIGYSPQGYPNIWLEREYYYSSRKSGRQKTDTEYAEDLKDFIKGKNVTNIYIDPSAASFKAELYRQGVDQITDADNDVINGIRFQSQLLSNGTFKICRNCSNTIREMGTYVWDTKASQKGEDKPVKEHDHCFTAGTPVLTKTGYVPIEKLSIGREVLTRGGYQKILKTFSRDAEVYEYEVLGKRIECTSGHRILTIDGWKRARDLIESDILFTELERLPWKSSSLTGSSIDAIHNLKILVTEITSEHTKEIALRDLDISIETFGCSTMEKYHKDTIFITKTGISGTTTLATSSVCDLLNTFPFTQKIFRKIGEKQEESTSNEYSLLQKNGMLPKREENGIGDMQKILLENYRKSQKYATAAKKHTQKEKTRRLDFVRIAASQNGEEIITLMMRKGLVSDVVKSLLKTSTPKLSTAQNPVPAKIIGKRKVYNINVENYPEFFVKGILVHNCADATRYALYTHFHGDLGSTITPEDIDKIFHEATGMGNNIPDVFQQPHEFGGYG